MYTFVTNKDVELNKKIFFLLPLVLFVLLIPTDYNLFGMRTISCDANEGPVALYLSYALELFFVLSILVFIIRSYIFEKSEELRKKIIFLGIGIALFLLAFSWGNIMGSFTENWNLSQFGYFGMPVFIGFLAYLIVKFEAFNIKLLGAQALVVSLFVLIGSQLFFIQNNTNRILTGITLALSGVAGWFLIKSSKKLDERKEQLQLMAGKLSQANDQLRTLDNAKTEFISIASHQLRTPLTAIKGFISMLLEGSYGKLIPQQEDVLNKVYSSNERLVNLVEDLLNVSRMESGRMEFKFALWDMDKICQEVIDTFALRAKSCKLDLTYIKPETVLPELLIDGIKVREVISNLVDNAIKYTLEGHGGVKVKLEQLGENIRVTVSDTGIGIPETELPYLFAKFSRGKDISRLNTGGTGLGLFVGKSMIENNGGRIWAESDGQDLGSRFIIELPIQQSEELIKKWG
ncbi:MAG: HAMP domain-containing sensor histidine kinase [Candidatus Moranbacteria bacterium]|nr:HAMP domain-containing sensor histidine kinase [Candidatus Moranbacteria bacterium]